MYASRSRRPRHLETARRVDLPQRSPGAVPARRVCLAARCGNRVPLVAVRVRRCGCEDHARDRETPARGRRGNQRLFLHATCGFWSGVEGATTVTASGFGLRASRPACLAVVLLLVGGSSVQAQSIASLFTTLPSDFAHLFTPTNGLIVGAGGAGSLAVHPKDDEIAADIQEPSGGRRDFFRAGASIGDGVEQGSFALGTYVVGRVWQ